MTLIMIFMICKIVAQEMITYHVNSSELLEYYFCNRKVCVVDETDYNQLTFLLTIPSYNISIGEWCYVGCNYVNGITITSYEGSKISCVSKKGQADLDSKAGFFFLESVVSINQVEFIECGRHLQDLSQLILDPLVKLFPPCYTSAHATALLLIYGEINVRSSNWSNSLGFAITAINLGYSTFREMMISSSLNIDFVRYIAEVNMSVAGCGMLLHFAQYHTESLINIQNSVFADNFDLQTLPMCAFQTYNLSYMSSESNQVPIISAAGLTILYASLNHPLVVKISSSQFSGNQGSIAGGMLIIDYNTASSAQTIISDTIFSVNFNTLQCSGSAIQYHVFQNLMFDSDEEQNKSLVVMNTQFIYHELSGAVYATFSILDSISSYKNHVIFKNTKFMYNSVSSGQTGASIFIEGHEHSFGSVMIEMFNLSSFHNYETENTRNTCMSSSYPSMSHCKSDTIFNSGDMVSNAAVFFFSGIGKIHFHDGIFMKNYGTVLHALDSGIYLSGQLNFTDNTASNGGAIRIEGDSHLYLIGGLNASFINNQALLSGGAIYAAVYRKRECAILVNETLVNNQSYSTIITMIFYKNSAKLTGNSIYATPLYPCYVNSEQEAFNLRQVPTYDGIFNFQPFQYRNSLLDVSTIPVDLKLTSEHYLVAYPGQKFSVTLTALDGLKRHVYSWVRVFVGTSIGKINAVWLSDNRSTLIKELNEGSNDTKVSLSLHTDKNEDIDSSVVFLLSPSPGGQKVVVKLLQCPIGFSLNHKAGGCTCSKSIVQLQKLRNIPHQSIVCSIDSGTITRPKLSFNSWLGTINPHSDSDHGISPSCPIGYCNKEHTMFKVQLKKQPGKDSITVSSSDSGAQYPLCLNNREGILCGQCEPGYSVIMGSTECRKCSNWWTLTFLLYAIIGPCLIVLLFALKISLSTGTLNGIIFYAQIANSGMIDAIVASQSASHHFIKRFVICFISILNLNFGIPMCLYDGMNELWKAGFQFSASTVSTEYSCVYNNYKPLFNICCN